MNTARPSQNLFVLIEYVIKFYVSIENGPPDFVSIDYLSRLAQSQDALIEDIENKLFF